MDIFIDSIDNIDEILSFLADNNLPVSDISVFDPPLFFCIRLNSVLIAVIGLEMFGVDGLLRSLAVAETYRGQHLAQRLVQFAEKYAVAHGITTLYLLTTTASSFFNTLGYTSASRSAAPQKISETTQFSTLCPASSAFLRKIIGTEQHCN
jgi:amino-acid N-acetyltransferase